MFACFVALAAIASILFVLFGPVPVKRRVMVVPRLSGALPQPVPASMAAPIAPSLVAQLASASSGDEFFTPPRPVQVVPDNQPIPATAAPVPSLRPARGGKVQPLAKKRSARGSEAPSPFAPVVRSGYRQMRDEDVATSPVERITTFDSGEFTTVDQ
jgi:hypothetical protein